MSEESRERQLFNLLSEQIRPISPKRSLRGFAIPVDVLRGRLGLEGRRIHTFMHSYDDIIRTMREHKPGKRGASETVAVGIVKEWQSPQYRDELLRLFETPPDRVVGKLINWSTEYSIPHGRVRPRRTKKW